VQQSGRLVFLVGANASGKSDLAVRLATRFSGEVISADSRQVFRRLNLGTGKLSREDMQGIPHHLIDIVEPGSEFNLFEYQAAALATISEVFERRRQPIIVGGTGLYIDSLSEGYVLVPVGEDAELRRDLAKLDRSSLMDIVRVEQTEALPLLVRADERRLIRAIEIIRSGISYAETRQRRKLYESLMIGLRWEKAELRTRIRQRLAQRFDAGMIDEVAELRRSGVSDRFLFDLGLEYRFILQFLDGRIKSPSELFNNLEIAIGQFARRQMTWFRRRKDIVWIDAGTNAAELAAEHIRGYLGVSD